MLRLPDPEETPEVERAAPAAVTDLSERRARNPLFREPSAPSTTTDDGEARRGPRQRARRVGTSVPPGGPTTPGADHTAAPADGAAADTCAACPFGVAMLALDEVQPDARDHLLAASRELLAAARTVLESLEHTIERQQRNPTAARPVQHVRVRRA